MEAAFRLGVFVAIFGLAAVAELLLPKRPKAQPVRARWLTNLGLLAVDVAAQRLTVGAAAFAAALWAEKAGVGLFHALDWPGPVEGLLAFLALDLAIWGQHVASHKIPVLWRLHQVHHADLEVDLTTGVRFHPLEIVLSMLLKAALVLALGADPWAVLVFEAALNASSLYTHANARLPERLDLVLRWLFCTPDMHRIHHSTDWRETDSNYGFFLSVWDRLFGTLRRDPAKGHLGMELGLAQYRAPIGLGRLLLLPFRPLSAASVRRSAQDRPVPAGSSAAAAGVPPAAPGRG